MALGRSTNNSKTGKKPEKQSFQVMERRDEVKHGSDRPEKHLNSSIPTSLLQQLLDVFRCSFSEKFNDQLNFKVQDIKRHLYNREFSKAFGCQDLLEAYCIRWSPARALAYLDILSDLPYFSESLASISHATPSNECATASANEQHASSPTISPNTHTEGLKVLCLGGGAGAEVVALAGFLQQFNNPMPKTPLPGSVKSNWLEDSSSHAKKPLRFTVIALDVAEWSSVIRQLSASVTTSPAVSKRSSPISSDSNEPFIHPALFEARFEKQDLLDLDIEKFTLVVQDTMLVTLMFTLNELYSTSMSQTTNFLLSLTYLVAPGSYLLIVDSPGSYSTVDVGQDARIVSSGTEKKYPMQWLLDHTLMKGSTIGTSKNNSEGRQWEKLVSEDSKWFRLPHTLRYPIDIEDMRYQVHLYRRL
ncbi:hypothetical protein MMC20_005646 [Loxospora ochrophaea]|nr:hypothetical protein [Loxospora ochrophaea]